MKKETVKEFVAKHEKGIRATVGIGLMVLSGVVGWNLYRKVKVGNGVILLDEEIIKFLSHVDKTYPTRYVGYIFGSANIEKALKPEDLGKLGEEMLRYGTTKNTAFTHFLAIGPDIES